MKQLEYDLLAYNEASLLGLVRSSRSISPSHKPHGFPPESFSFCDCVPQSIFKWPRPKDLHQVKPVKALTALAALRLVPPVPLVPCDPTPVSFGMRVQRRGFFVEGVPPPFIRFTNLLVRLLHTLPTRSVLSELFLFQVFF